jgi:hypothetical protein
LLNRIGAQGELCLQANQVGIAKTGVKRLKQIFNIKIALRFLGFIPGSAAEPYCEIQPQLGIMAQCTLTRTIIKQLYFLVSP